MCDINSQFVAASLLQPGCCSQFVAASLIQSIWCSQLVQPICCSQFVVILICLQVRQMLLRAIRNYHASTPESVEHVSFVLMKAVFRENELEEDGLVRAVLCWTLTFLYTLGWYIKL